MSGLFPHGVRDLKISAPTNVDQTASSLRCKVILVAKFDFAAETNEELSVKKGDVLKLLDRFSNGWVLVEFIDKIASPGLVPALYVDIAVNDPINPVTLLWLHEMGMNSSDASKTFNDVQVQMLLENNSPFSINNKLYPLSATVSNYLMYENRFWYRVDVTYSLGEQGYLCRYYLDFYDLHLSLLDHVNTLKDAPQQTGSKLPKLPEPVPSQKRNSIEQKELFTRRCRELSAYMHELTSTKRLQVCPTLVNWLEVGFKNLPGFVADDTPPDGEDINQRILPGSVILASKTMAPAVAEQPKDDSLEKVKFMAPSKDTPQLNKPKNVYNHYQQAANAKINIARSLSTSEGRYPTRNGSKLERARTVSTGNHTPKKNPLDLGHAPMTPTPHKSQSLKYTSPGQPASPQMKPKQRYPAEMLQMNGLLQKLVSPATSLGSGISDGDSEHPTGLKTPMSHHGTPRSAAEPVFAPRKASFARCEIKTQTNDQVVVRVNIAETPTVASFKNAIYLKIAYNNLYIRLKENGAYEEIDSPGSDVMETILQSDTVFLLIT
ncbi:hypothetical protein METBIDRAFT_42815 [Metschnikowia bicuspidata var. bicuspidata NRRL YB-4993]|uniref:SH3 domain-containing protein n=1 Tax=Metschnikowia bicuspidata var. bicuspidata NRRL YB-4993 TaxID=869754 RepID=A0A1A0HC79_9ASCO|nr:hypothetical protein METBIDRAFT_42815 [Metschnikowia bicuspidata var. bicuspidata NRRL YB-4993]OBA21600.1 hypothetical protein METBIDRAFT_42815 [Metschnikowia bicuspidata var. bicuspidata NRRL YB-4993]